MVASVALLTVMIENYSWLKYVYHCDAFVSVSIK